MSAKCFGRLLRPSSTSFTFPAKALVKEGERDRERDAKVTLTQSNITVAFHDDRINADNVLYTLPFSSVISLSYSKSKQPLWNGPGGSARVLHLDVPLGLFKGERHWVSLRTSDAFHVLRVNGDDVSGVLSTLEQRTGLTAERLTEKKDDN